MDPVQPADALHACQRQHADPLPHRQVQVEAGRNHQRRRAVAGVAFSSAREDHITRPLGCRLHGLRHNRERSQGSRQVKSLGEHFHRGMRVV